MCVIFFVFMFYPTLTHFAELKLGIALLESSTSQGLLTVLVGTFRRYLAILASVNVLKRTGEALIVAHNLFESRRIMSRRLLKLTMDIDHNRLLDPSVRRTVQGEFATFVQVRGAFFSHVFTFFD